MNSQDDLTFTDLQLDDIIQKLDNNDLSGVAYHISEKLCDYYNYSGKKRIAYIKKVTTFITEGVYKDYENLQGKPREEVQRELEANLTHYAYSMSIYPESMKENEDTEEPSSEKESNGHTNEDEK